MWYSDKQIPYYVTHAIHNTLMFISCELVSAGFLTALEGLHSPVVGFLRNKKSCYHQNLHLDSFIELTEEEILNKNVAYIVHLPLSYERLILRVLDLQRLSGVRNSPKKEYNTNLNDFFYVPLRETLILREDIYHTGNYGSVGNT